MQLEIIVEPLLVWYQKNHRILPWRDQNNPYYTWISEIMLQQTRVEAVLDYFTRFIKELPDVFALALCEEKKLLKLWEGLGYYNRVRNLQKAAQKIVSKYNGVIPNSYDVLVKLPGLGPYTAGAIASIAYQEKVAAVDGNVLRVWSRLTLDYDDISKEATKKKVRMQIEKILPEEVGNFNQALMELGALICLPNGKPKCKECPLQKYCLSWKKKKTGDVPVKNRILKRRVEERTVLLLRCQNDYAICKREEQGVLKGLYQFPNIEGFYSDTEIMDWFQTQGISVLSIVSLPKQKHIFSHIEWHMKGYEIEIDQKLSNYIWVNLEQLQTYSIPSAFQYYYPRRKSD